MLRWFKNVWVLGIKELKSLLSDLVLMGLMVVVLSVAIYSVATSITTEVRHASVAILDADHSILSYQIRDALLPPYFQKPVEIQREDVDKAMDKGDYVFVLDIPAHFERDVLAGRSPSVQVLADATSVTQAGIGINYLTQIIQGKASEFLHKPGANALSPVTTVVNIQFNPNGQSHWYISTMGVVSNLTLLAIILVGAAVIREREHGTIEQLLVMPVRPSEIVMAKILTNGAVIAIAALLSLWLVVHYWLDVPINGSIPLFTLGMVIYLFSVSSLGIWLATLAPTMPQFGLLSLPIYVVMRLLSGAESPLESMPEFFQYITWLSPETQFTQFSQDVLFRDAGFYTVWPKILMMTVAGALFLALALSRFRTMLAQHS